MKLENQDEVVISGIGGHFPKSRNIEEFKKALLNNECLLDSRWKAGERGVTNRIGKIDGIDEFDASYFGIHREQCNFMDPMQRMVLERTFEALIDAGVNPVDIRGKRVAVYAGSSVGENDNLFYESIISGFGITGHSRSMMPNRVSYWLNLKGPSCAYDNNWLNGIEVLQAAYDSIRHGYCESAIIATTNLALNSELSWVYNDMGLLSPDGNTRSFDAEANGYGRSDGIVVLYVQRACQAKRVYASILGASSRFNGNREGGFRDLDTNAMTKFIQEFYDDCKVDPKDVEYVECYGSAQQHIDEAELTAIDRVYCKNRKSPLLVGSVKPNTGHAEASAVLISLAKVLIAMDSGIIPANLYYNKPNPNIAGLVDGRLRVVTENTKWQGGLMAINGIGLASSYGHILLRPNYKIKNSVNDKLPRLINISTRTEQGIQDILTTLKDQKPIDSEYACLIQDTFKKSIPGHIYRGYAVLDDLENPQTEFEYYPGNKRQIWFVYSGMGSQWCKMAVDLMALPIFAESIHKSHKILEPKGIDLIKIITTDDNKIFDNILHSFVGIAAIQIALTDILYSLGIVPDGLIGHSVGELGCAYADGCFSAEQMILSAYSRGKASIEVNLIKGMMAAIGKGYQQMKDLCPSTIEVACHNGPDSCTISGPTEDMEIFVKELQDRGMFARLVNVSNIAYHSQYIKPAAPLLLKYLKNVIPNPRPRSSKWISTSVSEDKWDTDLAKTSSAEYHTNNLLSSVLFEEGSKHIPKDSIVIEIAPHGLLQAILKRSLKANCTNIPLTHRTSKNGLNFLLGAIGKMYLAGIDAQLSTIYPKIEYPVTRGTKTLSTLIHWEHGEKWRAGLEDKLNYLASVRDLNISLKNEEYKHLVDNQQKNTIIIPTSTYLMLLYDILTGTRLTKLTDVIFENLKFKNVVTVPKTGSVPLYVMVQKGSGDFEISSGNELIGTGIIRTPESEKMFAEVFKLNETDSLQLAEDDIYSEFHHRGHKLGGNYKKIKHLKLTNEGSIAKIQWDSNWCNFVEAMLQQSLFKKGECNQNVLMISAIQRIVMSIPLLPTDTIDLEVVHDYATGVIASDGIQVSGVEVIPLALESKPISYDSMEFTPFTNMEYKSIESGINSCLHIVMDNFEKPANTNIMIVEIETKNPIFEKNIKNVMDKYTQFSANLSSVKNAKMILISQTEPMYIIMNNRITEDCVKLLTSSHAFLLAQTDKNILSYPQITQVVQLFVNGVSYSLLRKTFESDPHIINIKTDVLSSNDIRCDNVSWVSKLKSTIDQAQDKRVYLATSVVPLEGINNFCYSIRKQLNMINIRFVFLIDKRAREFTNMEPSYQQICKSDLCLTVVKDGCVGSYIPTPVEFIEDISNPLQTTSNIIDNIRIDYLGVNAFDETLMLKGDVKVQLGNIDYSGINTAGENLMGLARFDQEFCKLVLDPILQWKLSSRWSLQDAATIPHAYAIAYYALMHIGRTNPNETVLIHNGCSAIGLAAISIASSIGCTVFTTVTSDQQKAFIKKQFKFMRDRNVLSARNTSFEPNLLLATGGDGAHVILNCVSGSILNATLRCVAQFGKIVQLGKLDLEEDSEIGLSVFLKNVSMSGLTPEDIFDAPDEIKKEIHEYVKQGMETLIVRPLQREIVEHQNIQDVLIKLKEPENIGKIIIKVSDVLEISQLNINKTNQFICKPKECYLLYGGCPEMWIDLLEWLVARGARKILIATESKPQKLYINRRIDLLHSYFNANIIFAKSTAQTKETISELLSEAYFLGPIGAVFVLPNNSPTFNNSDIEAVHDLDTALKNTAPKAIFINFLYSAAGFCHMRMDFGFHTYNIQWEDILEFSDITEALDDILHFKSKDIYIKTDRLKDVIQETPQSLYKKLNLLLPSKIEELKEETDLASTELDFLQMPSLCARVVREAPPVFIFPGMFGRNSVGKLALQLLHPVYCANYPINYITIKETALILAAKMKQIFPKGPYNIIGLSYGGILAIEVAKNLERFNAKIQLHFVDGAPDTIQGVFKFLGEGNNREIGLLCRVLNLTSPDIVKGLSTLSEWDTRLKFALEQCEYSVDERSYFKQILTTFKKHIDEILSYRPSQNVVRAPLNLLRPKGASKYDECGLPKYFARNAEIYVLPGNHISMLEEKETATTINNKVMC